MGERHAVSERGEELLQGRLIGWIGQVARCRTQQVDDRAGALGIVRGGHDPWTREERSGQCTHKTSGSRTAHRSEPFYLPRCRPSTLTRTRGEGPTQETWRKTATTLPRMVSG